MLIEYMLIAGLGGFAGTCGRYLTGVAGKKLCGDKYPAGTFAVNVIGCFIIGLFVGLWNRHEMSPLVNALLISGFCGGFRGAGPSRLCWGCRAPPFPASLS